MVQTILLFLALTFAAPVMAADASVTPDVLPFFSWEYWGHDSGATRSEIFRNFGLAFIALVGLVFGIWRAWTAHRQAQASVRQAEIAQQGHITDRYSKAVEQLGSENVTVRIGGIYALKRIAQDSLVRDHISVMEVLTNFIRHSPYAQQQQAATDQVRKYYEYTNRCEQDSEFAKYTEAPKYPRFMDCPDIIAAIDTIQTRSDEQKNLEAAQKYSPSLKNANFSFLILNDVDLSGFDLNGAQLQDANVIGVNLSNVDLSGCDLQNVDLSDAILSGINLSSSDLIGTIFMDAILNEADITGADLTKAFLCGADITGANLTRANLTGADLRSANLTGADLTDANLTRAVLKYANLSNTNLSGTHLNGTYLDIRLVHYDEFMRHVGDEYADLTAEGFQEMKDAPNLSMAFTHPGQAPRNLLDGIAPPPEQDEDC